MRDKIELFLSENPSRSFKAGEIAKQVNEPKGDVKRRLKRLAKLGKVAAKKGRYHSLNTMPTKKRKSTKPHVAVGDSASPATRRLEEMAQRVGISVQSLQRWVEEKRRKTTDDEKKKLLYGVLYDLERSKSGTVKERRE